LWSFSKGFADSLKGAIELFFLDYRRAQQKEHRLQQREIDRELILNRDSPAREIQSMAKRRALERRERERLKEADGSKPKRNQPNILERTLKCCVLNGGVFMVSIVVFESVVLPLLKTLLLISLAGSQERSDAVWRYTEPVLSVAFSTLWVLPFFLLSKIVNAIWFQDIADLAFRY